MIDVKEAAKKAAEYFADLYAKQEFSDLLLEEVEYDEQKNRWYITLGFVPPSSVFEKNPLSPFYTRGRQYKVFDIDAETGKVVSMKIRTVEHA